MKFIAISIMSIACCGCQQDFVRISEARLHQLVDSTHKDRAVDWIYLGTDDNYHYFARQFVISDALLNPLFRPQSYFKVEKGELHMTDVFQPSDPRGDMPKCRSVFEHWTLIRSDNGIERYELITDFNERGELRPRPTTMGDKSP